ncbi:unnamed protein product [Urochloa humidicola]
MTPRTPAPLPSERGLPQGLTCLRTHRPPTTRRRVLQVPWQHVRRQKLNRDYKLLKRKLIRQELRMLCKFLKRKHRWWRVTGEEPHPDAAEDPMPDEDGGDGGGGGHNRNADLGAYSEGSGPRHDAGLGNQGYPSQSGVKLKELVCHGQNARFRRSVACN